MVNLRNLIIEHSYALALLDNLSQKIKTIIATEPLCSGTAYYREDDKLYANHSETPCPLHGQHPNGGRLRTYVGNDPAKCDHALKAMATHQRLLELRQRREYIANALNNAGSNIDTITAMLRNATRRESRERGEG